jgi:DNA-binding CsgD family transcriptional regulator
MKSIDMVAKTLDDTGHFGGWNLDISWHRVSLTFTNEPPSHRRQCAHVAASRQRVPRGPCQRKRPTSGWASLTRSERDVVRLVSEGLANNDIATRLFISPRTVQTHLTHVYTKLGLTSRVQLVQEAARHN